MIRNNNVSDDAQIAFHKVATHPLRKNGRTIYVDASFGNDGQSGLSPKFAKQTIQNAIDTANSWDTIMIFPKLLDNSNLAAVATDPADYAETIIIPVEKPGLALIGVGTGRTQGGLPQIKIGAGSTAMITIRAAACLIANLGINGASSTGGGILLDDDSLTKAAFGTTILNCHFKNCKRHATQGSAGGAITVASTGGAWQVLVKGCKFYNCVCGIASVATGVVPTQDWTIEDCNFSSSAKTLADVDIFDSACGITGLVVRRCNFGTVNVPATSGGNVSRYIKLSDSSNGVVQDCTFGYVAQGSGSLTAGATGTAITVPVTVRLANCWGECESTSATGAIKITL
jgi:hypothetical protein